MAEEQHSRPTQYGNPVAFALWIFLRKLTRVLPRTHITVPTHTSAIGPIMVEESSIVRASKLDNSISKTSRCRIAFKAEKDVQRIRSVSRYKYCKYDRVKRKDKMKSSFTATNQSFTQTSIMH